MAGFLLGVWWHAWVLLMLLLLLLLVWVLEENKMPSFFSEDKNLLELDWVGILFI